MISRRNFLIILLMMGVLLFMFQFSQLVKENGNDYETNEYYTTGLLSGEDAWQPVQETSAFASADGYALFVGDAEGSIAKTVEEWCFYVKIDLLCEEHLTEGRTPGLLLVDGASIDYAKEETAILSYASEGVPVIFCSLPEASCIEEQKSLQTLLGITEIKDGNTEVEGLRLFDGFLLGGEAVYKAQDFEETEKMQDFILTMPWYVTGKGTKTYMVGLKDETEVQREEFPRILWRNRYEDTFVFAVNGDYLADIAGLGILDGFLYEMQEIAVYPVVNAQSVAIADYPSLSTETDETMQAYYSRSSRSFVRDVMWPGILAMSSRQDLKMTCFLNAGYEGAGLGGLQPEDLVFYLQQLKEAGAEAGLSMNRAESISVAEQIAGTRGLLSRMDCDYSFGAVYEETVSEELREDLETNAYFSGIHTLTCRERGENFLLSYYTDDVTLQGTTGEAGTYSYRTDFANRSLATALAYSNTLIDMHRIMWPETEDDRWEKYFNKVFSNISTYYHTFSFMEDTTLSVSDSRVRSLLNLSYEVVQEDDGIAVYATGIRQEAWFLLRTHGQKIADITNGEYEQIEQSAYLVKVQVGGTHIRLTRADEILQYKEPFTIP